MDEAIVQRVLLRAVECMRRDIDDDAPGAQAQYAVGVAARILGLVQAADDRQAVRMADGSE